MTTTSTTSTPAAMRVTPPTVGDAVSMINANPSSHLDTLWLQAEVMTALESLPKKERRAFQTALDVVPALVQAETPVLDFLRTENMNAAAAARRLAAYWHYRKQLFVERWLLPMNQTGTGALSAREIELLRTGYQAVFPRGGPGGGLLVVVDFARIGEKNEKLFDPICNIRVTFYLCTVLTDAITQQHGATCVYIVRSGQLPPVDTNPEGWKILHQSLPVRIKQMIVARAFVEGKEGILNYLAYQRARVQQFRSGIQPEQLIADSLQGTLALLQDKGVDRRHLPRCVGGDWDFGQFLQWVRARICVEDVMSSAPLKRNSLGGMIMPGTLPSIQMASSSSSDTSNTSAIVLHNGAPKTLAKKRAARNKKTPINDISQPEQERQRKLNALYSRRAYHKRKLEMVAIQEQINALETHKKILQTENRKLEALVEKAQELVKVHTGDETLSL